MNYFNINYALLNNDDEKHINTVGSDDDFENFYDTEEYFWDLSTHFDTSILKNIYSNKYFNTKEVFLNKINKDVLTLHTNFIYSPIIKEEENHTTDYTTNNNITNEILLNNVYESGVIDIINDYKKEIEYGTIFNIIEKKSEFFSNFSTESNSNGVYRCVQPGNVLNFETNWYRYTFKKFYFSVKDGPKFSEEFITYIIESILPTYTITSQRKIIECFLLDAELTTNLVNSIINLKSFNNWSILLDKQDLSFLSFDLIIKNKDNINIIDILSKKQFLPNELQILSVNQGVNFWNNVMRYQNITEEFIIQNEKHINITYLSQRKRFSEQFIRRYSNHVDWTYILKEKYLSRKFLSDYQDKVFEFYFNQTVQETQLIDVNE